MSFKIVEINEVIVLLIILFGYIPIIMAYIKNKETKWLFIAYTALLIGAIATIAEVFIYPKALNYIEHAIGVMGAGIFFLVCAYMNYKKISLIQEKLNEKMRRVSKWSK